MGWLSNLSIKYKILIIPMIAIVGFVVFLLFIVDSGGKNGQRLEYVKEVSFPVLQMANSNIVIFDRMNELMTSAASTGEQEMLDAARRNHQQLKQNFTEQASLKPSYEPQVQALRKELETFSDISFSLTQSMIDGTMDFSQIADVAERKRVSFEKLTRLLQEFRDDSYTHFTGGRIHRHGRAQSQRRCHHWCYYGGSDAAVFRQYRDDDHPRAGPDHWFAARYRPGGRGPDPTY